MNNLAVKPDHSLVEMRTPSGALSILTAGSEKLIPEISLCPFCVRADCPHRGRTGKCSTFQLDESDVPALEKKVWEAVVHTAHLNARPLLKKEL